MEPVKPDTRMIGGSHYLETQFTPWDIIESWCHPDQTPMEVYLWGNALKYLHRYRRKNKPVDDLEKAIHYLERAIEEIK